MTEEKQDTEQTKADNAWANVGEQFKRLGESLAAAVSATWESEETQRYFEQVKVEVSAAAQQISTAIKEAADSEEGQRVQTESDVGNTPLGGLAQKGAIRLVQEGHATAEQVTDHVRLTQVGRRHADEGESRVLRAAIEDQPVPAGGAANAIRSRPPKRLVSVKLTDGAAAT